MMEDNLLEFVLLFFADSRSKDSVYQKVFQVLKQTQTMIAPPHMIPVQAALLSIKPIYIQWL